MKTYTPTENDFIRSTHQPDCYTDGIVVDVDKSFVTFVVRSRVCNGNAVQVDADEIACAPLNGRSMFDDPFQPRIEQLGRVPSFSMTETQAQALARFRAAREVIYPPEEK